MIFPSSGQNVHTVDISFPDSDKSKKPKKNIPKFVVSESEKRLPVTDVESTATGEKIKFVHHGIRMVMFENSKLTKEDIIKNAKVVNPPHPGGFSGLPPSTAKKPHVNVYSSDEVMPEFLEKLTVGMYSPERSVQNFQQSAGRLTADSHISTIHDGPRSPHSTSESAADGVKVGTGKDLMLDQYLNIHTYGSADASKPPSPSISLGKPGIHLSVKSEMEAVPAKAVPERKESPKRHDVPLLDIFGTQTPGSQGPPQSDHSVSHSANAVPTSAGHMSFDDSAPTTAVPGAKTKPRGADLAKQLSAILDRPGSNLNSANISAITTPARSKAGSKASSPRIAAVNNTLSLDVSASTDVDPTQPSPFPQNESPVSAKSAPFDVNAHIDLHKLLDAPTPKVVAAQLVKQEGKEGGGASPVKSIVVKLEGATFSPSGADQLDKGVSGSGDGFCEVSARSFGADSLSALSDSLDFGPGGESQKQFNSKTSTRANQLREQMTRANLVRMDSLVTSKKGGTLYTSKTLVGANKTNPAVRDRAKKNFVKAARLIVAFRSKNVVNKGGPAFALQHAPDGPISPVLPRGMLQSVAPPPPVATAVATAAALDSLASQRSQPVEMPTHRSTGQRETSLSIMTDSVFDDSPTASVVPSPTNAATGIASAGMQATPGGIPRSSEVPHRKSETPQLIAKQSLFDFKPPEEVDASIKPRKNVGKFIASLKERVGSSKAQLIEQQLAQAADSDSSVVTSYFDHNAAPIFVEREKLEKHKLHSKRFDKTPDSREYRSRRYAVDSDEEDDSSRMYERGDGQDDFGLSASAGAGQSHWARDGEEMVMGADGVMAPSSSLKTRPSSSKEPFPKSPKPMFDLNKFIAALTELERTTLASFPQETMNQIVDGMNTAMADSKGPKTVNKRNLTLFKTLLEQMRLAKLEVDRLNMDIHMEQLDISDRAASLTVSSVHGGAAMTRTAVESLRGLVAYECREIPANSFVDLTFSSLRPHTTYFVYAVADSSEAKLLAITDEDRLPQHLVLTTQQEILDIEWSRLTKEMQIVEIKAALRSNWLREAAAAHYPVIALPVDDDIHLGETVDVSSLEKPDEKTRHVVPAKNRKATASLPSPNEQQKNVWRAFLEWWVGQSSMYVTKIRSEFHLHEALFAAQQDYVTSKYLASGLVQVEEISRLVAYAKNTEADLASGRVRKETMLTSQEFRRFRSWYKGGQVLQDVVEETIRTDGTARSLTGEQAAEVQAALDRQLAVRDKFLQLRIDDVEACKSIVRDLVASRNYAVQNNLKEDDLLYNRAALTPQDLIAIMSSKRLLQLCIAAQLTTEQTGLEEIPLSSYGPAGKFNYMKIANTGIFTIVSHRNLRPEDPPAIVMCTLPGTSRKPLKAWQLCSYNEKMMEISIACSLDNILRLALADRIVVPNPEDVTHPPGKFPSRDAILAKFIAWYAGEEEQDRVPGHAPPTLARTVFGETWETDSVRQDPFVLETLYEHDIPVPEQFEGHSRKIRASFLAPPGKHRAVSILGGQPLPFFDPLIELYQETISKISGAFLRSRLMSRHLCAILGCRRMVMLRWLWPPGAARTGRQFLFPRMGLTALPFDLPPPRIKPFPSRRTDAYTIQEMLRWYSPQVLDEDDALMVAGEAEGVRLRAYHNWLAQEKDRQEESRRQMLQEDFDGHMRREIVKEVEFRMRTHANKLKREAERAREHIDSDKEIEFKFSASLPSEYWYIFEESQEFKHGSGVHNEDELEEYRDAERQRARNAEIEAEKFENYLQEEIMRRDAEEQARLKREDQDRRLAEGVARRRRLREHLEDLKRAKQLRIEEMERNRIENERRKLEEAAYIEYIRQKEKEELAAQARLLKEHQQMHYEDMLVSDNRARSWEVKRMEHEDIRSFMREQEEAREEIQLKESYRALEELYQPFEPFPEQLVGDHMRSLQGLLHHGASTGVDRIYQEVMDTLSQSSSHRKSLEQTTESMDRKRSIRYIRIFEGTDGANRPVDTDATSVSCTPSLQLGPNVTQVDDINIDDEDDEESRRREIEKFNWLRKPSSPPVRSVTHNPTKHTIRSTSSKMPNTYDTQWNVLNNNSTQCFVRTSSETFHTPGPLPTMRKLSSMAPMLCPLQETLSFEEERPRYTMNAPTPKAPSRQSGNEAEILKKFGSLFPSRTSSVRSNPPLTPAVAPIAATDGSRMNTDHTFVFDDSIVLDSIEGAAGGGSGGVTTQKINSVVPTGPEYGENNYASAQLPMQAQEPMQSAHVHASQALEGNVRAESGAHIPATVHFTESLSSATGTADMGTFTGSSLSVFNSITPVEHGGVAHAKKQSKERKKLKRLLSNSADMLAKTNEKEWLQFLQTQRKATFASLATLDAKTAAEKLRIEKLTMPVGTSTTASGKALDRPSSRGSTLGGLSELRDKKTQVELLKKELKELGIVEESLLDFRTRKMAKSASEAAIRMKAEKDMLREYVTSGAVLRDEYYLMAVQPGTRSVPSLEVSAEVQKFAAEITQHVDGEEELNFPSMTSSLEIAAPPKPTSVKPKSPAVASRSTPKVSLHFGPYQPPTDLFIDQVDEPQVKEPDVQLDLGVRGLSRTQEERKANSSTKKTKASSAKIGLPMNHMSRDQRELASSSFLSFNSLSTLSAPPSGNTVANPLGVIRGNPVPTAREAPSGKHRKAAATRPSASSSSSALPLGVASLSLAEGSVEKKSSMLSKSVELFIHTPTSRKNKTKLKGTGGAAASTGGEDDDFEESLASTADISITERQWLQQDGLQRPPPSYSAARTSGGASVASLDSAGLI